MSWQPIDTAPKDGTRILAWRDSGVHLMRWKPTGDGHGYWDEWHVGLKHLTIQPTHWMPLPNAPNGTNKAHLADVAPEMLALLEESQKHLTGDWRERRDALLLRLNGDEE